MSHDPVSRSLKAWTLLLAFAAGAAVYFSFAPERGVHAMRPGILASSSSLSRPLIDRNPTENIATATFAMGWFWGPDSRFGGLSGVVRTRVGYAGGTKKDPTYRSLGDHSESVEIDYDPAKTSYRDLLRVFWAGHDPSNKSWSRQYASIIFVRSDEERRLAEASKVEIEQQWGRKVATVIAAYSGFTPAEGYHQKHDLRQFPAFLDEYESIYPSMSDFVASTAVTRVNSYLGGDGSFEALKEEVDGLGLSPALQEELLRIVGRHRSIRECPVPGR